MYVYVHVNATAPPATTLRGCCRLDLRLDVLGLGHGLLLGRGLLLLRHLQQSAAAATTLYPTLLSRPYVHVVQMHVPKPHTRFRISMTVLSPWNAVFSYSLQVQHTTHSRLQHTAPTPEKPKPN